MARLPDLELNVKSAMPMVHWDRTGRDWTRSALVGHVLRCSVIGSRNRARIEAAQRVEEQHIREKVLGSQREPPQASINSSP